MATSILPTERSEDRLPIDVFVVSPNTRLQQDLQEKLQPPRWNVLQAMSGAGALELLRRHETQDGVLLLDPQLPDLEANGFNAIVRDRFPRTQVMMLNSHTGQLLTGSTSPTPVSARLADVVNRVGAETVSSVPAVTVDFPRTASPENPRLRSMIGDSQPMHRTYTVTRMVAARTTTVLVTGESGTGKDLLAQEIHLISPRRNQPFVVVNCSAIPEPLLEAELFGYTRGSFTGAVQSRIGRVHAAHGGTLFLDEIGDMPLSLQSKILRFLEQGEVQRLGGNDNLKVDVRVVAATNADLKRKVADREFREDLYYRLAVFPIHLPPLRDRMEDLEELAIFFVAKFRPGAILSPGALEILRQHRWPGNVRELRNAIERATILAGESREIKPEHIFL
ncbi:MAG TPA: sigma-54 dependent transcriptional regulator [Acidobacteriaceae bacterium]|jgi:transcriptional regulator with PAS, ATPase and Fis domain|nr:sigma-54 dependent transcriptional regulator [Acidobacteriaceae bacterium]